MTSSSARPWWGDFALDVERPRCWRIGSLELVAVRAPLEWRLATRHAPDPILDRLDIDVEPEPDALDASDWTWSRFSLSAATGASSAFTLAPLLADRSMVARPTETIIIPSQEEVQLFVSTPLWVSVHVGEGASQRKLTELPAWRPSDTWSGTPIEGELCYASTTRGKLVLEELLHLPHRAITCVVMANRTLEPLLVERISVPVRNLALYRGESGHVWTETIQVTHSDPNGFAQVQLTPNPHPSVAAPERIAPPRLDQGRTIAHRVFSNLFWRN